MIVTRRTRLRAAHHAGRRHGARPRLRWSWSA